MPQFTRSNIGKKQLMGLTGLFWSLFLIGHLVGNIPLLFDARTFNEYAHFLTSLGGLLYTVEVIMLVTLLMHFGLAISIARDSKKAKPVKYQGGMKNTSFASATMIYSGIWIFVYMVLHIYEFKLRDPGMVTYDGVQMKDLYTHCRNEFAGIGFTIWYSISMAVLGIHLSHGFQSAFQSLGLNHPKYFPVIRKISVLFAVVIGLGFAIIAIGSHIQGAQ